MQWFGDTEVAAALPWAALLSSLEEALVDDDVVAPQRTAHQIPVPGGSDATMLMKPAWRIGDVLVVKVVNVHPDNGATGLPMVNAGVLLFDASTGVLRAACDGNELTTRRTAAASALAADRLVRPDAERLLVVGTGALAPRLAEAHCHVRQYRNLTVWGRRPEAAAATAQELAAVLDSDVTAAQGELPPVHEADTVTCATGSTTPLVLGSAVKPGTHVDLVGAFSPTMRESDDDLISHSQVWVDTLEDAVLSGDLAAPLAAGKIARDHIQGDLADLARATSARRSDSDVTVFVSVGTALEDLVAARLVAGS